MNYSKIFSYPFKANPKMHALKATVSCCFAYCISLSAIAFPVSPATKDIASKFPIELQIKYALFADSQNSKLGYFVARQAGITNKPGTNSVNLKVISALSTEPYFPPENLKINGSFDSTGARTDLNYLLTTAKKLGLTLLPAPISDAETFFIADGFITDASGKIQPYCSFLQVTLPNGTSIKLPSCSAMDQSGNIRPLQSIYALDSSAIDKTGNTQQQLAFDAKAFNQISPLVSEVLASGAGWDNFFSGQLRWQINNGKRIEIATVTVNWIDLYAELVKYMAEVNYVMTEQDAYLLAIRIIKDTRLVNTVKIKLTAGYSWGPWWNPNLALLENIANELVRVAKSKSLIIVEAKTPGTNSTKRFYTLNIDYKKLFETPIQTFSLYQRNNTTDLYASTDLSIQCVVGEIDGEVIWNFSDPRCDYLR